MGWIPLCRSYGLFGNNALALYSALSCHRNRQCQYIPSPYIKRTKLLYRPNAPTTQICRSTPPSSSPRGISPTWYIPRLVDVDALLPQVLLREVDLDHELLVRLGHVVEGQDAPAEGEEEVGAEGDEDPEGELAGC